MSAYDALPAVGLAELTARASLQTRTDRKYVVPATGLAGLLRVLGPGARVLEMEGLRAMRYDSTYFDTPALTSFHDAAHGRRRRWKVRTRTYADTAACWCEVKLRGVRETTVKDRVEHPVAMPDRLTAGAVAFAEQRVTAGGLHVDGETLRPTLRTSYRRTTLLLPAGSRVTVDAGLSWQVPDGRRVGAGDVLVVETKTAPGTRDGVDRHLWALGHRPVRLSKYATGLAVLHPHLSANRWHRTTTRWPAAMMGR